MTKDEITRLAAALNQLRPDWGAPELRSFIWKNLAERPLLDATLALMWIATDPQTRTPARVLASGPWWSATRPTADGKPTDTPAAIDDRDRCKVCGHTRAGHDHLAAISGDTHPWTTPADWHNIPLHRPSA